MFLIVSWSVLKRTRRQKIEISNRHTQFNAEAIKLNRDIEDKEGEAREKIKLERLVLDEMVFGTKKDIRQLIDIHISNQVLLEQLHVAALEVKKDEPSIDWNLYQLAVLDNDRGRAFLEGRYAHLFGRSVHEEDLQEVFQKGTPFSNS